MKKVIICGILGNMGKKLCELLRSDNEMRIVCGVDSKADSANLAYPVYKTFNEIKESADVIIDFSSPAVLKSELKWATEKNVPAVLAATGYSKEQLNEIHAASQKVAVFKTANFSLGINLLVKLVKDAAEVLGEKFDIEIIEKHHNLKADAPSGTALMLAESVNSAFKNKKDYLCGREGSVGKRGTEIGLHAVRGGTIVGEHEVMFAGEDEIITLSHSARSKTVFASGAITAAKWLCGKSAGMYSMDNILKN